LVELIHQKWKFHESVNFGKLPHDRDVRWMVKMTVTTCSSKAPGRFPSFLCRDGRTDGRVGVWVVDGWMYGRMEVRIDGWMDGWIDRGKDGLWMK